MQGVDGLAQFTLVALALLLLVGLVAAGLALQGRGYEGIPWLEGMPLGWFHEKLSLGWWGNTTHEKRCGLNAPDPCNALGGDRPELNRHHRCHKPRLCH